MKTQKIIHKITLEEDVQWIFGPIEGMIGFLMTIQQKYPDYELSLVQTGYYESSQIDLIGTRPETDEEYAIRLQAEIDRQEKALERKRKRFEKLKSELQ